MKEIRLSKLPSIILTADIMATFCAPFKATHTRGEVSFANQRVLSAVVLWVWKRINLKAKNNTGSTTNKVLEQIWRVFKIALKSFKKLNFFF